ncbi:unnamed protein product [Boreogadus saida]
MLLFHLLYIDGACPSDTIKGQAVASLKCQGYDLSHWNLNRNAFIMPPKSKISRANGSRPAKKTAKRKPANRSSSARTSQAEVDILSPAAMENLYYIAHNAADCLEFRGFGLQNSKKKKKKKGKGRKKKSKGKK